MKNLLSAFSLSFCLSACSVHSNVESNTQYVDPFVGAAEFGHCIPNACFPFGLIQVGPQSGNCSWDYTGGYQYKDTVLYGFSQTRVNGTGCPDLGDLLMLPYTGDMEQKEYASGYQKKNQFAEPGYYMVYLDDYEVNAEMTASPHVAIHRYTFNTNDSARLLIDFQNFLFRCMPSKSFDSMGLSKSDTIKLSHSMRSLDFTSQLSGITCPVTIVCGEKDSANLKASKKLNELLPQAILQIVPGAGHEINKDAPEVIADILNKNF